MPPASWCGCGSGKKPAGHAFWALISSGVIAASLSQVMPAASFTRTPSCTALPRDIVTPGAGRLARS